MTINFDNLPEIKGARVRLYQLFQNLINNSIKFRKSDVDPIIQISCKRTENEFEISLKDNGIGIKREYFGKIFKVFTKLNGTKQYGGSGIGLATCKKIMKQLKGDIKVQSTYGEGTTFILFFPME